MIDGKPDLRTKAQKKRKKPARQANVKMTSVDLHVAEELARLMKVRGLDDAALADRLGCAWQQVSKYRRGLNRISAGRLHQIAVVFDVRVGHFYRGLTHG